MFWHHENPITFRWLRLWIIIMWDQVFQRHDTSSSPRLSAAPSDTRAKSDNGMTMSWTNELYSLLASSFTRFLLYSTLPRNVQIRNAHTMSSENIGNPVHMYQHQRVISLHLTDYVSFSNAASPTDGCTSLMHITFCLSVVVYCTAFRWEAIVQLPATAFAKAPTHCFSISYSSRFTSPPPNLISQIKITHFIWK